MPEGWRFAQARRLCITYMWNGIIIIYLAINVYSSLYSAYVQCMSLTGRCRSSEVGTVDVSMIQYFRIEVLQTYRNIHIIITGDVNMIH